MLTAPSNLTVNGMLNPLGLVGPVAFSWWVNDSRSAEIQSAFEIEVASTEASLLDDAADLWRSGVVASPRSASVAYAGVALSAEQGAYWRVRSYDSDGLASPWSTAAYFEMGILTEAEWQCQWISPFVHGNRFQGGTVARLQRTFELPEQSQRGRLYIGVLGACRVTINGNVINEAPIDAWADFPDYHYARVLDVSDCLLVGLNKLELMLGDGYASGKLPGLGREVFTYRSVVRCMLFVEGVSSRRYEVVSDGDWWWLPSSSTDAQTLFGEHHDGRQLVDDWIGAEVDRLPVQVLESGSRALMAPNACARYTAENLGEPVRRYSQITTSGPPFVVLEYDVGAVIRGALELELVGRESDAIEVLYSLDRSFQSCSVDRITTAGNRSSERYSPNFAEHCFRFARVRYAQGITLLGDVRVRARETNLFFSNTIDSDSDALTSLLQKIDRTKAVLATSAPLHGVRLAERLPDLGQVSTWGAALVWDPDNAPLLDKWLEDAREGFRRYTNSAPYSGGRVPMPMDTDEYARLEALLEVLLGQYLFTRDSQLMAACYPELRALAIGFRHGSDQGLRSDFREDLYGEGAEGMLVANATLALALRQFVKVAEILREIQDVSLVEGTLIQLEDAFKNRYLSASGRLVHESQASLVGAIVSGTLAPDELQRCRSELVQQLHSTEVSLPPALTKYLLPILSDAGAHALACELLFGEVADSVPLRKVRRARKSEARKWFEVPELGGDDLLAPHGVGLADWVMRDVVGIEVSDDVDLDGGRFHVCVHPKISPLRLTRLSCHLPLPCGELAMAWYIDDSAFRMDVTVPVNCAVDVTLPDGGMFSLSSGQHQLHSDCVNLETQTDRDGVPTLIEEEQGTL